MLLDEHVSEFSLVNTPVSCHHEGITPVISQNGRPWQLYTIQLYKCVYWLPSPLSSAPKEMRNGWEIWGFLWEQETGMPVLNSQMTYHHQGNKCLLPLKRVALEIFGILSHSAIPNSTCNIALNFVPLLESHRYLAQARSQIPGHKGELCVEIGRLTTFRFLSFTKKANICRKYWKCTT